MTRYLAFVWAIAVLQLGGPSVFGVQDSAAPTDPAASSALAVDPPDLTDMRARAIAFLKLAQSEDGSFSPQLGPGVTALVTYALLRTGVPTSDLDVTQALEYLERQIQKDGGIYNGPQYQNYETSLAIMCLHAANHDGRYDDRIAGAAKFVKQIQWDSEEGVSPDDARYGGQGYGSKQRPDLSNTGMFIDALEAIGTDDNDPAIQEALKFISRSQNLTTPHNDTPFAPLVNDGGFYYTPAGDGESKAETTSNGGLRSYASMTYVGFKSLLYAGVDRNDPRVRAAYAWIVDHYSLDENPGVGQQGLYYYYHVFAKALDAYGEPMIVGGDHQAHDWRKDLIAALARRQREDGSWANPADRWYEGDAALVTGYSLLALSYCNPQSSDSGNK